MTLGQLAQELGKSVNSLANTLRQVGLADRLLYESDIILEIRRPDLEMVIQRRYIIKSPPNHQGMQPIRQTALELGQKN